MRAPLQSNKAAAKRGTKKETVTYPIAVVRLIVCDNNGGALLLQRSHTAYGAGKWCLPGGKVDHGITVEQAVVKELKEETRLDCLASTFLFYQDSLPPRPGAMHCINLYFECKYSGEVVLNEESSRYAWVNPAELAEYDIVFRNDAGLKRYWEMKSEV